LICLFGKAERRELELNSRTNKKKKRNLFFTILIFGQILISFYLRSKLRRVQKRGIYTFNKSRELRLTIWGDHMFV
jgi:hypothetical protein